MLLRITWRRNVHNNLDFLLKTNILNNIEKDKLTIIRNKNKWITYLMLYHMTNLSHLNV